MGNARIEDCTCAENWTGPNCDLAVCDQTLPFLSLGLLLLEASYPEELREKGGLNERKLSHWSTYFQVNSILRTADANGDGNLDIPESVSALYSANMNVSAAVVRNGVVWAFPMGNTYKTYTSTHPILDIVKDAVGIFVKTGTFYANTEPLDTSALFDVSATYPNSTWDNDKCEKFKDKGVDLSWGLRLKGSTGLIQQCAYVNSEKVPLSRFDDRMATAADCHQNGETRRCQFNDPSSIKDWNRKRFYCVFARFCDGNDCTQSPKQATPGLSRLVCKTGLLYDGLPADVIPSFVPTNGVQFQWLDTQSQSVGYRIFRDSYFPSTSKGQLLFEIGSTSPTCGQQYSPVQFADRETGIFPGRRISYVIAPFDKSTQLLMKSAARVYYTQPWVSKLHASVNTENGVPVGIVDISIQHFVEDKNAYYLDPAFGNVVLTTGMSGAVSYEIQVADSVKWAKLSQEFLITPAKCTGVWKGDDFNSRTCDGILHVFEPPTSRVSLTHIMMGEVSFTDITTFSIKGFVIFGDSERAVGTTFRPDYDVKDWVGTCPTIFKDQCYCPVEEASLTLTTHSAVDSTQNLTTSRSGYFAGSSSMFQNNTLTFSGYKNHTFELWEVTTNDAASIKSGTVFDALRSSITFKKVVGSGLNPSYNFTANANTYFVFVDVQARKLLVQVLGGDVGVKFVTGQRALVQRASCGFSKQVVTVKGEVSTSAVPPTELDVIIPNESTTKSPPPECSGFVRIDKSRGGREANAACRVPLPKIVSSSNRLGCSSTLPFTYIDEYFAADNSSQMIDLSSSISEQTVRFTFISTMCLQAAIVAPPSSNRTLQSLAKCGSAVSDRVWPPTWLKSADETTMQEALLLVPPKIDVSFKDSEFGKVDNVDERAIFCESDVFNISISLVEVYPTDSAGLLCDWPEDYVTGNCNLQYQPESDFAGLMPKKAGALSVKPSSLSQVKVQTFDGISAGVEVEEKNYDHTTKWGFIHEVIPSDPNPFAPFTNIFEARFSRTNKGKEEVIDFVRRAVTLGVIPEDVPQLFTMTTNPTLIFAVLHDPPGGASFTTLKEGSSININMEIDGMHAGDLSRSNGRAISGGVSFATNTLIAPTGIGKEFRGFGKSVSASLAVSSVEPAVSISRSSAQAFDVGFSFDVELSTSENPQHAGQASDLILGGGMDLQVIRAVKVKLASGPDSTTGLCSIVGITTSEWLPDKITTWLMTPYQIEMTIERLYKQHAIDKAQGKVDSNSKKTLLGITNWEKVLKAYRDPLKMPSESMEAAIDIMIDKIRGDATSLADELSGFVKSMDRPNMEFINNGLRDLNALQILPFVKGLPVPVRGDVALFIGDTNSLASTISQRLERMSRTNCGGGNMFGMGKLCDSVNKMKQSVNVVKNVLSMCDNVKTGIKAVTDFCQKSRDKSLPGSVFDALKDTDHLVTFSGGGSSTTISYSITQSKMQSQHIEISSQTDRSIEGNAGACIDFAVRRRLTSYNRDLPRVTESSRRGLQDKGDEQTEKKTKKEEPESDCRRRRKLGVKIEGGAALSVGSSVSVAMSRSASRSDGMEHAISFTLKDDDDSDFFAVKIFNDKVHGTPAFQTVGGISSGPGETGTSKIDSFVTIKEIRHYCTGNIRCDNVQYGKPALVGVIIQNLSPLRQENSYQIFLEESTDPWSDGKDYCGEAGYSGGLKVNTVKGLSLPVDISIPFGQREVLLLIEPILGFKNECLRYKNVGIGITASSESSGSTYQYKTAMDEKTHEISVTYPEWDHEVGMWKPETVVSSDSVSLSSFSVSWTSKPSSTLDAVAESSTSTENEDKSSTLHENKKSKSSSKSIDAVLSELKESRGPESMLVFLSAIAVTGVAVFGLFVLHTRFTKPAKKTMFGNNDSNVAINGPASIRSHDFPASAEEKEALLSF